MDTLSADLLVRTLSFLGTSDVTRALAVNKMFRGMRNGEYLWQSMCNNIGTQSLRDCIKDVLVRAHPREDEVSRHFAQRLEACADLDKVKWLRLKNSEHNRGPQLEKMEAHTATALLNRFVVVVGGWCNSSDNRIDVIDGGGLDVGGTDQDCGGTPLPLVTLPAFTENTPTFRYGFSTTEHNGRLIVLGGCRGGGYSNDCNNCYFVDLRFHCTPPANGDGAEAEGAQQSEEVFYLNKQFAAVEARAGTTDLRCTLPAARGGEVRGRADADWQELLQTPSSRVQKVVARYSANVSASPAQAPSTRAYHTAVVVRLDGRDSLLVRGGLHHRAPTTHLELCDLSSHTWRDGVAQGQEPSPRFGHSCVPLLASDWAQGAKKGKETVAGQVSVDRLVFTGGSDGSDLVRNGRELREIHVLHIVRGAATGGDVLVWSSPRLASVPEGLSPAHSIPGRCHCAVQVGERVLYFGGAANSTNTVYALTVPPPPTSAASVCSTQEKQRVVDAILTEEDENLSGYSLHLPSVASLQRGRLPVPAQRHQGLPRARLSAAAALVGRYWLVVGGFSVMHREMGDVWALDTAYGTSASLVADRKGVQEARDAARSGNSDLDFIDGDEEEEEDEEGGSDSFGEEEWGEEEEGEDDDTVGGPMIGGQALINILAGGMVGNAQQQALVLAHLMSLGVLSPHQAYELLHGLNQQDGVGEGEEGDSGDEDGGDDVNSTGEEEGEGGSGFSDGGEGEEERSEMEEDA